MQVSSLRPFACPSGPTRNLSSDSKRRPPTVSGPAGAVVQLAGALAVTRLEARDPATGVQDLLLAGVERVAVGADLDVDLAAGLGAASGEVVSATTGDLGRHVGGVNSGLHGESSFDRPLSMAPGRPQRCVGGVNRNRARPTSVPDRAV